MLSDFARRVAHSLVAGFETTVLLRPPLGGYARSKSEITVPLLHIRAVGRPSLSGRWLGAGSEIAQPDDFAEVGEFS